MGIELGTPSPDHPNYWIGDGIEGRREVILVKRALAKIGIFLEGFDVRITGVMSRPRPMGFDFICGKSSELLALAKSKRSLGHDNRSRLDERFVASQAKGESFRQIGDGASLHLIIALNGRCNVHIDTHGFVDGNVNGHNVYNFARMPGHGVWDLLSDLEPGLFAPLGDRGLVGPWIGPGQGMDGHLTFTFGVQGFW